MTATARRPCLAAMAVAATLIALASTAPPAAALNPLKPLCKAASLLPGAPSVACPPVAGAGGVASAGENLATGNLGGALGNVATATESFGLSAIVAWATGSAGSALDETARVLDVTSRPALMAPWFSQIYWRVAGIAVLLTLPFLFAAAVQALLHSDLTLLMRSAFGYLPLAMLGVGVAAQVAALLLATTDELSGLVASAGGGAASHFLTSAATRIAELTLSSGSPFLAFVVAAFTVAGAIFLWLELLMREAAVYVIVGLLPLAFAALVWPARRVWALRAVEVLVALILSKLAIVAVLTLGGAALSGATVASFLTGLVLVLLGVFAPWAMLRLIPMAELASGAAGRLRGEAGTAMTATRAATDFGAMLHDWVSTTAGMRRDADRASPWAVASDAEAAQAKASDGAPDDGSAPLDGGSPVEAGADAEGAAGDEAGEGPIGASGEAPVGAVGDAGDEAPVGGGGEAPVGTGSTPAGTGNTPADAGSLASARGGRPVGGTTQSAPPSADTSLAGADDLAGSATPPDPGMDGVGLPDDPSDPIPAGLEDGEELPVEPIELGPGQAWPPDIRAPIGQDSDGPLPGRQPVKEERP